MANSLKTANVKVDEIDETSGGVGGGLQLATHVPRSREKMETEKEKRNGAVPMMTEK